MPDVSLNGIEFKIRGDSGEASASVKKLTDQLNGLRVALGGAASIKKTSSAIKDVGKSAKSAQKPLATFLSSLKRIAMYRIMRTIIKSITQAFQEGLKNAYQFDKTVGGRLSQSLDLLATKSMTMKNQLGAAFGGLLTAITPIIVTIINLVTKLASAITRLLAILGGSSTWLKAKDSWTEWGEAAAGAGGAAKEALKYLAPFDELNVLPSQKNGGGGGGGSDDFGDMFDIVDISEGSGFIDALKEAFQNLANWFEEKDWQDIGKGLWDKFKEIFSDGTKANEVVTAFFEAIGAAFGAVAGTAWGFLKSVVDDLIKDFKKNLIDYDGDGKVSILDFLKGAWKTITDIGGWIKETIVNPLHDGFVKAFGEGGESAWDITLELAIIGIVVKDLIAGGAAVTLTSLIAGLLSGGAAAGAAGGTAAVAAGSSAFSWVILGAAAISLAVSLIYAGVSEEEKQKWKDSWAKEWEDFIHSWTGEGFQEDLDQIQLDPIQIPIEGIIEEIKDNMPPERHKMDMTAEIENTIFVLPEGMTIEGWTAIVNNWKDGIADGVRNLPNFLAKVVKFKDDITEPKNLFGFIASIFGINKDEVPKDDLEIDATAKVYNVDTSKYDQSPVEFDGRLAVTSVQDKLNINQRTLQTRAQFKTTLNSLPVDKTTFKSRAQFTASVNKLKPSSVLFPSKANFTSSTTKNLPADKKIIATKAKFNQVQDNLSANQKTVGITAKYNKVSEALSSDQKTISVKAKITSVEKSPGVTFTLNKNGGVFQNGAWSSIPQFASGGSIHGSLFLAGEAGAEVVGTVGGRTEVLNRSQIASAIYSAVRSAMVGTTIRTDVSQGDYEAENEEMMYRAFSRALADSDLGGDIELDGDVLYRAMVKRNRRNTRMTGVNAMA